MKKSVLFFTAVLLLALALPMQMVSAQDKTREEKEKQEAIQKAIEDQKRAMVEQKKAQEEALEALQKSQDEVDKVMKDINLEVTVDDDEDPDVPGRVHIMRTDRNFRFGDPSWTVAPEVNQFFIQDLNNDNESTSWQFSRKIREKSLKSEYAFDVEKTSRSVVMSVMGDCKEGEIRVKIVMPSGKTYSDVVIDEFGNLNWRKSFNVSESENQDKTGAWKFIISSNKATGYFKISLQAY